MAWFLLLVIFYKPIYFIGQYFYHKFYAKDDQDQYYYEKAVFWFASLVNLVWPEK